MVLSSLPWFLPALWLDDPFLYSAAGILSTLQGRKWLPRPIYKLVSLHVDVGSDLLLCMLFRIAQMNDKCVIVTHTTCQPDRSRDAIRLACDEKDGVLRERRSCSDTPAMVFRALAGYGSQYSRPVGRNTALDGALRRCDGAFPVGLAGLSRIR